MINKPYCITLTYVMQIKKINKWRIILFAFTLNILLCCFSCSNPSAKNEENSLLQKIKSDSALKAQKEKGLQSLTKNIGETFSIENFIDTSGKSVKLDFSKSDITIVDFWFDGCTACIKEMNQFKDLIEHKEKKVTIISTCISSYPVWKNLFTSNMEGYSFLKYSIPNWSQLSLKSTDDLKLHNTISEDRRTELVDKLDVSFFPSYFVIDKAGVIIARPISAVEYIKNNIK